MVDLGRSDDGSLKNLETLERVTLKDQVRKKIKAEILTGGLDPDTVFSAGAFAELLGVSLTPVREALLELEAQGLIEILPKVGFRVVIPTKQELREMFEVREMLEIPTMGRIAGTLASEVLEQARELCRKVDEAAGRGDLAEFLEWDRAFHVFLVSQAGNLRLARLVDELRQSQHMPALRRLVQSGNLKDRGLEHWKILDAIERGDTQSAVELTRQHLALSRRDLT